MTRTALPTAPEDTGKIGDGTVDATPGPAGPCDLRNRRATHLIVLQLDPENTLFIVINGIETDNVPFILQNGCDALADVRGPDVYLFLADLGCIPYSGEHVGNRIA